MSSGWKIHTPRWLLIALFAIVGGTPVSADEPVAAASEAVEQFEKQVRPILVERCQSCHGAKKQWASLRLDSRAGLLKGGDSGAALVPGKPAESELLTRVTEIDESLRMPPAESGPPLTAAQIAALTHWIQQGAPWPDSPATASGATGDLPPHWAFQPVTHPTPPDVARADWIKSPVDAFVLARLEAEGLAPSPEADRRTLIRRATYDLTGLPPSPEDVAQFEQDHSPDAYERLIDRLLDSKQYGEQWGRHWLDVARYSDTKGYVYAREERNFVHASLYRDWVVRALNEDMPYDRFLLLQLAADQAASDPRDLAAMGYLTLGRRFLGVTPDIIDDRIDVVTRGAMGLTVACARCHDHKYDPIPTADYYSLYGVFQSSVEQLAPLPRAEGATEPTPEFLAELKSRQQKLSDTMATKQAEAGQRIRELIVDYLMAQRELDKYPVQGFDQILAVTDLIPSTVRRWQTYLDAAAESHDPVWVPWLAFAQLPEENFASAASELVRQWSLPGADAINPRVAANFSTPPTSPRDVAERYGQVFAEVDRQWKELTEAATRENRPAPESLPDPADESLRRVLYAPGSPCVIPDEPIVNTESLYDSGSTTELWRLQGEVDRWVNQAPHSAPHSMILTDRSYPTEPVIFRRGNPATPGDPTPRQFLTVIAGENRQPFSQGSGRLEMARAIVDPTNPLTARVWVNRVWMYHFGAGLVRTPSDFGRRAEAPSHPELLDWLASEFVAHCWSTKWLHRTIMLSAAYRQASDGPTTVAVRQRAQLQDPANRLLWRMNVRRLTFEELRDTLLAVSGELDLTLGGKAIAAFSTAAAPPRRSLYQLIDRQFIPSVLRMFDFANPDLHSPQRSETTVPQQALFALNHPFVARRAEAVVRTLDSSASPEQRVRQLYRRVLQREPTETQRQAAVAFVAGADTPDEKPVPPTHLAWSYGYGELDTTAGRLKAFTALPHNTGAALQGGGQWPDAALGWVQITAQGGHAGDDLQHAAVRRWTAPAGGTVAIASTAKHEHAPGDGIRCWMVSSRHGLLGSATLHNSQQTFGADAVEVQAGDTLDFVVDYNAGLNSDMFLWAPRIEWVTPPAADEAVASLAWNAEADFGGTTVKLLSPWEQLAQVLLVSNELLFVD